MEILDLLEKKTSEELIRLFLSLKKNIIITRGEKGAVAINNNEVVECPAKQNLKIKDLTGAGDLFAAGYLHGFINNLSTERSLEKGTELSSNIIEKIGARL